MGAMKPKAFVFRAVLQDGRALDAMTRVEAVTWIRYALVGTEQASRSAKLFRVPRGQTSLEDGAVGTCVAVYGVVAGRVVRIDERVVGGTVMVTARMSEADVERLSDLCAIWKMTRTEALRHMVRQEHRRELGDE
jgi:hypothetical protein